MHTDANIQLIPGDAGDFKVTVDGRRIWDKRGDGSGFPEHEQILSQLAGGG